MKRYQTNNDNKIKSMAKLYSQTSRLECVNKQLTPKDETIDFLLNYSRSVHYIDCATGVALINLN